MYDCKISYWFDLSISVINNNLFNFNSCRSWNVYTNSILRFDLSWAHELIGLLHASVFSWSIKSFEIKMVFHFMIKGTTSYKQVAWGWRGERRVHKTLSLIEQISFISNISYIHIYEGFLLHLQFFYTHLSRKIIVTARRWLQYCRPARKSIN